MILATNVRYRFLIEVLKKYGIEQEMRELIGNLETIFSNQTWDLCPIIRNMLLEIVELWEARTGMVREMEP